MKNKTFSNFSPAQNPSYLISVSEVLRCGVPTTLSVTVLAEYPIKVTAELIHGNSSVAQTESTIPAGALHHHHFTFYSFILLHCIELASGSHPTFAYLIYIYKTCIMLAWHNQHIPFGKLGLGLFIINFILLFYLSEVNSYSDFFLNFISLFSLFNVMFQ